MFEDVEGEGDVILSFYSDGVLVDEVHVSVIDGAAGYDLAGNQTFDEVVLSTEGDLGVSLDDVTFLRIEEDVLQIA